MKATSLILVKVIPLNCIASSEMGLELDPFLRSKCGAAMLFEDDVMIKISLI